MEASLKYSQLSEAESLQQLHSNQESGLSHEEAKKRSHEYGRNVLRVKPPISKLAILVRQFKSIIVLLLAVAAGSSFFMGHYVEALTVIAVLVINAALGFFTELKAIRAMEALKKIGVSFASVLRSGEVNKVPTKELVPGDIVLFEAGDILGADVRILEANNINANESILTGESAPVDKVAEKLMEQTILAERKNILFRGTALSRGSGLGVVIATGMHTEVGRIAKVTQEDGEELTPLEQRLEKLGAQLVWVSLLIAVFIAAAGIISGKDAMLMFETALALAVATIPEGLPIVATLALAKGMWRMAANNALINKLAAVETLGATSIIFTDKTGTLTENKMSVRIFASECGDFLCDHKTSPQDKPALKKLLHIGALCNSSQFDKNPDKEDIGDPMEIALLEVAHDHGIELKELEAQCPEEKVVPFDSDTFMMATYHKIESGYFVAVKGAPEAIIAASSLIMNKTFENDFNAEKKEYWSQRNQELANDGLRILGLAYKEVSDLNKNPYENLIFAGLTGLLDPAREDVKKAITQSKNAGIKTIMVTGDQEGTALKIAKDIGLIEHGESLAINGKILGQRKDWSSQLESQIQETRIFSRVSPEQKLDLIKYFQTKNLVVAMTGDGVNDAPALKNADIGIAMGLRGTQIAKEASDMILQDDRFNTIILAIKQGRIIYSNIQRFVIYLLSCNISEILVISIASLLNAPLPLLPLQILFLNLVTDVFPALALGMGDGDDSYLNAKPRPRNEEIITKRSWGLIALYGIILTISVLGGFFYTLEQSLDSSKALTVSFLSLAFAQLFHVFNMRLEQANPIINDITRNIHVWGAFFLCSFILIAVMVIPAARELLKLQVLDMESWKVVITSSLMPLLSIQILTKLKLGLRI